ncbi:MAG: ABC transporter ATP-binding protein [Thermodesulfobacteriota bacterium]
MERKVTLFKLLLRYRYSFIVGLIALSLVDVCMLIIPRVIEKVIDALTLETVTINDITRFSIYILGIAVAMSIFRFIWRYFIMGTARKIEQSLRNDFFSHLQSLNFDFFSNRKVGDLMAHTVNDIETIKFASGLGVLVAYDGIFLFVFILIAMALISPELALYAFIPFPVLGFVIYIFGNKIEKRFQKVQDSFSEITEQARQAISGIKVIKSYTREEKEYKGFSSSSNDYLNQNLSLIKVWGIYQPLITFLAATATAIFLWIGGVNTINMNITLGDFAAILIYLTMLTWPMMAMGWAVDIIKRGNASINRINKILEVEPKKEIIEDPAVPEFKSGIKFQGLNFSYNGRKILDDVNLKINYGKAYGITGSTGSGKTTLIKLLMKIDEPSSNHIFIDSIDLAKIRKEDIRKNIIFVPQETTVFSGTIKDNISFMNPSVKEEDIVRASKLAQIYDEIVEFPDGFDTRVGERGLSLSGGQRQRIAIARAILLDPKVLILDDVFSSLDLQTENVVMGNLREIMKQKTLIAVSSRVPSISGLDEIIVFENGKIVEEGSHETLMQKNGIYASLYSIQTI